MKSAKAKVLTICSALVLLSLSATPLKAFAAVKNCVAQQVTVPIIVLGIEFDVVVTTTVCTEA